MKTLTKLLPLLLLVVQVVAADIWSVPSGWTKNLEGEVSFEKPNVVFGSWTQENSGISVLMFSVLPMVNDVDIRDGVSGFVSGVLRSGHYPEVISSVNIRGVWALKIEGPYVGLAAEYWQEAYIFVGKSGTYVAKIAKPTKGSAFDIENWVIPVGTLTVAENPLKLLESRLGRDALKKLQEFTARLQEITRKTREAESKPTT